MSKTLILYYSYEGSTKRIAEYLANSLTLDIERIMPVREMKTKGFGKFIWGGGQVVMKRKPKINALQVNLDQYDTVLLGSPIWAGTFAPSVYTVLETGMLKNKKIAYFYCHEGGDKHAISKARESIEKNNEFISACPCMNVEKNFDTVRIQVLNWVENVLKQS
jgi:menaquinone-dependent protoporphyrinogen IX oxidase